MEFGTAFRIGAVELRDARGDFALGEYRIPFLVWFDTSAWW